MKKISSQNHGFLFFDFVLKGTWWIFHNYPLETLAKIIYTYLAIVSD
jgi:hypothetical protein